MAFSFQRWFITLRSKVVGTVADVLELLSMNLFSQEATRSTEQIEARILVQHLYSSQGLRSLLQLLAHASSQFTRLVKEFDLLALSFIGMDRKSMKIVSDLGLSCSLLAFSIGLTLRFSSSHYKQNCSTYGLETSGEQFHTLLIHDLLRRLGYIDLETSKNLWHLLDFHRSSRRCSMQEFQNEVFTTCVEARDVAKLCKYFVQTFLSLQAIIVHDNNGISRIPHVALQLLFNIIFSWIQIPFQTPKHFFQIRPPISAELFITNEDGQGFATCLLEVSAFPVGSYQINWHSCCIDNNGAYWSLMPLNTDQFFTVQEP
ncbi:hypothetical protein HAX54_016195 [Datura stramonium]|uniref:Integrator complex subunit 7-like C-terminal domain-containing protein n=1 Tax=Datura stramonium TaxID=4076 RepID=A0ABS8UIE6_DATST|nr:hypothetical protein [Datura stramonium]